MRIFRVKLPGMAAGQRGKRPGGRSAHVEQAVLAAGAQLIVEGGTGAVTVAELARISGVHAATIYRRWGGAPGVVLALATRELQAGAPISRTGRLRDDLFSWAQGVVRTIESPGGLDFLRAVLAASDDPAHSTAEPLVSRAAQLQEMLDEAAAEVQPPIHFTEVLDGILAPIYFRKLFGIGGVNDAYLHTLVTRVLAGRDR